ncbi:MAG TPA: hypothetical protein VHU83_18020 [Bryobacteraceae bacterium]|nr:hypothetical protein [Bryobacteraceae bacterium]
MFHRLTASCGLLPLVSMFGILLGPSSLRAQTGWMASAAPQPPGPSSPATTTATSSATQSPAAAEAQRRRLKAAAEVRAQEHQRILGVMPNFNTSNVQDAEPLTARQKFELAAKGAFDPFTFAVAGLDAGLSQAENDFPEYRQGALGYAKRFGASYADSFDSTMIGNALFPVLLKQDPRYFRKGTGSFASRFWYAVTSTVRCKNDGGKWAPNYSNVLGNIAAGGISNLYYPSADRGAGLTFQRAATVTAEGALGAVFIEFWPDISRKLFTKHAAESSR